MGVGKPAMSTMPPPNPKPPIAAIPQTIPWPPQQVQPPPAPQPQPPQPQPPQQAFQAQPTMNQIQRTMPQVQHGVQRMPIHQPQVANAMNVQPPRPAGQVQHSQALQQLLQTLKSPNSLQQQQEEMLWQQRLQQLQHQQQQHHQNPALQMHSMQQQPQQQPQDCCVGLSELQAHGSVSQAQNSGPDMFLLQQDPEVAPLTPQEQLSCYIETL
ncbi:hypothetical protein CHS0354_003124 [Potamilus streckersoni]|uniref:Uncharacterized protein n=1 Tax=Potamilus streckersoni TaxID=2493646 RepID=A0AAE0RP69_9BIVA|nr:hypothetical protein CHS0354_003124 [Potamilus streckersoni]